MDCIDFYRETLKKHPLLSHSEERDLIAKWRNVNESYLRQLLVLHNLRGAISLGSEYYANLISQEDGIQLAIFGLVKASESFDLDKGYRFLTYAVPVMKTSISRKALSKDNLIHYVSSSMDEPVKNNKKQSDGNEKTTKADFVIEQAAVDYIGALSTNSEKVATLIKSEEGALISRIIDSLPIKDKNKEITKAYFNLSENGYRDMDLLSQTIVAERYGVSRRTVSVTVEAVISNVREILDRKFVREFSNRRNRGRGERNNFRICKKTPARSLVDVSTRYKVIETEQSVEMGKYKPKKVTSKVSYYGSEWGGFYTDRYQAIMRRNIVAAINQAEDDCIDEHDEEIKIQMELSEEEEKLLSQNSNSFTVGYLEDDGDLDYEAQE